MNEITFYYTKVLVHNVNFFINIPWLKNLSTVLVSSAAQSFNKFAELSGTQYRTMLLLLRSLSLSSFACSWVFLIMSWVVLSSRLITFILFSIRLSTAEFKCSSSFANSFTKSLHWIFELRILSLTLFSILHFYFPEVIKFRFY